MPNTKSAIRRVRRVKKQTQVNRIRKSKYKNAIKQMDLLLKGKEKEKVKNLSESEIRKIIKFKKKILSKAITLEGSSIKNF